MNKTIFYSKFVFFRKNRPKEWPMLIFFNFFLSQKSYKWIIAKNENQFGFILRFGPPINFTINQKVKFEESISNYCSEKSDSSKVSNFSPNLSIFRIWRCHQIFIEKSKANYDHVIISIWLIKWGASSRWSFGPNPPWGSIDTTTIGITHPSL